METTVQMSAEELKEFQAFQAKQAKKKAKEERKNQLDVYKDLVDDAVRKAMPKLIKLSKEIQRVKQEVYDDFMAAYEMKRDILKMRKDDQNSDTYRTKDNTMRIKLGYYTRDVFDDTVNEGVAMIKERLDEVLADEKTSKFFNSFMKLLQKNNKGDLQSKKLLQIEKEAREMDDEKITEGIEIIKRAHTLSASSTFVRAEIKNSKGGWVTIPLSTTNVEDDSMLLEEKGGVEQ